MIDIWLLTNLERLLDSEENHVLIPNIPVTKTESQIKMSVTMSVQFILRVPYFT